MLFDSTSTRPVATPTRRGGLRAWEQFLYGPDPKRNRLGKELVLFLVRATRMRVALTRKGRDGSAEGDRS